MDNEMYAMKVLDLQLVVVASPEATLYIADYVKVGYWAFEHTKKCNDFSE